MWGWLCTCRCNEALRLCKILDGWSTRRPREVRTNHRTKSAHARLNPLLAISRDSSCRLLSPCCARHGKISSTMAQLQVEPGGLSLAAGLRLWGLVEERGLAEARRKTGGRDGVAETRRWQRVARMRQDPPHRVGHDDGGPAVLSGPSGRPFRSPGAEGGERRLGHKHHQSESHAPSISSSLPDAGTPASNRPR